MSYSRISFCVVESNFEKKIQNSWRRIKFDTLFVSLLRIGFCSVDLNLYQPIYIFPSSILKYFLLVFLVFIILIFAVFYPCVFFWFFLLRIIILQNKASVAIESDFFFWWSWRANNIILIRWYKRWWNIHYAMVSCRWSVSSLYHNIEILKWNGT